MYIKIGGNSMNIGDGVFSLVLRSIISGNVVYVFMEEFPETSLKYRKIKCALLGTLPLYQWSVFNRLRLANLSKSL